MPRNPDDLVTLRHPALPAGQTHTTSIRSSEALVEAGWVEVKSSKAKAVVETTSPDGEPLTPSQEEDSK